MVNIRSSVVLLRRTLRGRAWSSNRSAKIIGKAGSLAFNNETGERIAVGEISLAKTCHGHVAIGLSVSITLIKLYRSRLTRKGGMREYCY